MLFTVQVTVKPEWVDYNSHMADYAYGLVFSDAGNAYLEHFNIGAAYLQAHEATFYTLESRIGYLKECHRGDRISVTVQLVDLDKKRVHFLLVMRNESNETLALSEQLLMHVSQKGGVPKSATMPDDVFAVLRGEAERHQNLPKPRWLERRIGIGIK